MAPNPFVDAELGALRDDRYTPGATGRFLGAMWRRSRVTAAQRPGLVRELGMVAIVGMSGGVVVGALMAAEGVPAAVALLVTPLSWLVLCAWVYVELGLVRHPVTDEPTRAIGPANVLSLYRGWAAVPLLAMATFHPVPTVTAVVVAVSAGLTDLVDGPVAVRRGEETRLGRLLDPVVDSFLFSAVAFGLWRWGLLPGWVVALVAVRYFAVVLVGIVLLFARGRSLPVRHTAWGRRSTMAIGLTLLLAVSAQVVAIPDAVLLVAYALTALSMLLALVSIARQAPLAAPGDGA
ncbi:MAG: hypothetical protein QOE92_2447 [Chloroflexota bacterium]|nr:hypothetical protein [Chloroflexota bacterium]